MKCPICGEQASLTGLDYGRGAAFRCYNASAHRGGEFPFLSDSPEALAESETAAAQSKANAAAVHTSIRGGDARGLEDPGPVVRGGDARGLEDPGPVVRGGDATSVFDRINESIGQIAFNTEDEDE